MCVFTDECDVSVCQCVRGKSVKSASEVIQTYYASDTFIHILGETNAHIYTHMHPCTFWDLT